MRLKEIHLKNFGPYHDMQIRLSAIESAVVLGPNGAGKSIAFIDGIRAALFGRARSSMDDMIRTGTTDMMLSVTFELNQVDYRVTRKRSIKTKAGKTDLELQVWGSDAWTSMSGGRLAETQEKITALLNCDDELLTATSFFIQGQADRFSRATPGERKTILAGILRLDQYRALKQQASRLADRARDQRTDREAQLQGLDGEIAFLGNLEHQERDAQRLDVEERDLHERLKAGLAIKIYERSTLQAKCAQAPDLAHQIRDHQGQLANAQQRELRLQERHKEALRVVSTQEQLEGRRQDLARLEEECRRLDLDQAALTERHAALKAKLFRQSGLEQEIADHQAKRKTILERTASLKLRESRLNKIVENRQIILDKQDEARILTDTIASLTESINDVDQQNLVADKDLAHAITQQMSLQGLTQSIDSTQRVIDEAVQQYHRETDGMEAALGRDKISVELLGKVPCDAGLQARCLFTIEAVAARDRIRETVETITSRLTDPAAIATLMAPVPLVELHRLTRERDALTQTDWHVMAESLRRRKHNLQEFRKNHLTSIEAHRTRLTDTARFTKLVPELEIAERDLPEMVRDITAGEQEMADLAATTETQMALLKDQVGERAELASIQESLTNIESCRVSSQDTSRALAMAIGAVSQEIDQAQHDLPEIARDLSGAIADRIHLETTLKHEELELLTLEDQKAELAQLSETIQTTEQHLAERTQIREAHQRRLGELASQITTARQNIMTLEALKATVADLDRDVRQYSALDQAYGIIPTLVMENAIPVLEQETNQLLGKISRTGMRARFDTQKALKSREGLAETLDIAVHDQIGERPIENYSGGERFRLDLAIRVGLSKLLARRAGARIETLAIDEGLGSLDEDGLAQLRECLGALGDDFKLVLVITHVDAMKATFPSQIMVTADIQDGSQVEVLP